MIPAWSDQTLQALNQGVLPPTTGIVQLPLPRVQDSVGAARVRDVQLLQFVADLLLALDAPSSC